MGQESLRLRSSMRNFEILFLLANHIHASALLSLVLYKKAKAWTKAELVRAFKSSGTVLL